MNDNFLVYALFQYQGVNKPTIFLHELYITHKFYLTHTHILKEKSNREFCLKLKFKHILEMPI